MSEQSVQKVFFVALCVLLVAIFAGIGLMMFSSGPTGAYHVDASYTDGIMVARLVQDRRFWVDVTLFRGTPERAWELYFRVTEAN